MSPFWLPVRFIENTLYLYCKTELHKKRQHYINQAIDKYTKLNPDPADLLSFKDKLETEADRVYAIVDRSILRERIKRGTKVLLFTIIASILVVGLLAGFYGGSIVSFVSPIAMTLVAWATSVLTIPVSYNQRVKGAMDTVYNAFAKAYQQPGQTLRSRAPAVALVPADAADAADPLSLAEQGHAPAAVQGRASQTGLWAALPPRGGSCPELTRQQANTSDNRADDHAPALNRC